jgi:hypothetical protein
MQLKRLISIAFVGAVFGGPAAQAAPLTFSFNGIVTSVNATVTPAMHPVPGSFLGHPFVAGETFHGTFTVDSTAPDINSSATDGTYLGTSFVVHFANGYSTSSHQPGIGILNDFGVNSIDQFSIQPFGSTVVGSVPIVLTHSVTGDTGSTLLAGPSITLRDDTGSAFNSTQLFTTALSLSNFPTQNSFTMTLLSNDFENRVPGGTTPNVSISGRLTLAPEPLPTPIPAALPLFATGLSAMGLLAWRRKREARAAA